MISYEDIKGLSKEDCVKLAVKAAKLVSHLSDDPKVIDAIEAAEDWLANPNEENKEAARAADAATDAAWAAYGAAYGAAANAAANAACWAAAYAANGAAHSAIEADPNTKPILVEYLEELLVRREYD